MSTSPAPRFVSVRVITDDVARMADFYERVTGIAVRWSTPDFAELDTPLARLAIGHSRTIPVFGVGAIPAAQNRSAIIEFLVADVDADHARLVELGIATLNDPTTMPWGNRSLLLRDPDGNLVGLFTPVTPEARAKFGV